MKKNINVITTDGKFTAESFYTDGDRVILKNATIVNGAFTEGKVESFPLSKIVEIFVE